MRAWRPARSRNLRQRDSGPRGVAQAGCSCSIDSTEEHREFDPGYREPRGDGD